MFTLFFTLTIIFVLWAVILVYANIDKFEVIKQKLLSKDEFKLAARLYPENKATIMKARSRYIENTKLIKKYINKQRSVSVNSPLNKMILTLEDSNKEILSDLRTLLETYAAQELATAVGKNGTGALDTLVQSSLDRLEAIEEVYNVNLTTKGY